jgi:hypothetical protein
MEKFEKIAGRNPMLSVFRRCCGAAMNLATSHCRHDWRNFWAGCLGAAILFDQIARKQGTVTLEELSSDHAVVQQRVYNFLCSVVGSDPQRLESSLVTDGYLPQSRAMFCRKEWTQLNYGWWTILEPHLTDTFKSESTMARRQARDDLDNENAALSGTLRQMRGQSSPRWSRGNRLARAGVRSGLKARLVRKQL